MGRQRMDRQTDRNICLLLHSMLFTSRIATGACDSGTISLFCKQAYDCRKNSQVWNSNPTCCFLNPRVITQGCCSSKPEEVFMQVLGPISGGWWRHHHWTRLSYHINELVSRASAFFKVHTPPSTGKIKASVGFEPRTDPELRRSFYQYTTAPSSPWETCLGLEGLGKIYTLFTFHTHH